MPYSYNYRRLCGLGEYAKSTERESYLKLAETVDKPDAWTNQRLKILMGSLTTDGKKMQGSRSSYNMEKWKFLLDAPFPIGDGCCNVMKKSTAHAYAKETGRVPIIATMASESKLRTQKWLQHGCNAFEGNKAASKPMSFWTEQDVLAYILIYDIKIASVYGDIVDEHDYPIVKEVLLKSGLFDSDYVLKTTGADRTGCMFCGYGVHMEKQPGRFERMKHTHPKQYNYIMKPVEEGGLGYREILEWLNEHGNLDIRY